MNTHIQSRAPLTRAAEETPRGSLPADADIQAQLRTLPVVATGLALATCMYLLGAITAVIGDTTLSATTISFLLAVLAGVSATATA